PRRVLDPAGNRGRGPLPRILEGPAYARPFLLALAGGQAARGLRRHVLGASRGPAVRRPRSPPTIPGPCGVPFDSFINGRVDRAAINGVLNGEASVDRPGNLREGLESGEGVRSEEHTSELQSRFDLVCHLLL